MTEVTGHLADTPIDFFDAQDMDVEVSENTIERLTGLANAAGDLQTKITDMATALAEEQEKLVKIVRVLMPNMMDELGMKEFKMVDGRTISIDPKVNASIKEENRPAAFKWLEEKDFDGIIKTKVIAEFGKGDIETARKALDTLHDAGYGATMDRSIHAMTLTSFVKERLGAGDELPPCFSVFEFKEAKIKKPKASKKSK